MTKNDIIPVNYGESVLPESMVFIDGDSDKSLHIDFIVYLIKAGDKLILVDAGCVTMPGFVMKNFIGVPQALENIGIKCSDITDVIITHSHHDHIECAKYFEKAIIHIQEEEYHIGEEYLRENKNIQTFKDEKEVSAGIKAIKIGGHSIGSCIVEIDCEDGIYVITGDECYSRDNITKRIPTGSSVCAEKSKMFVERYSDPKYKILLVHNK